MLHLVKLLLPALIPSWRFFDEIAPSPRIEYALLKDPHETPTHWQEFRPRPAKISTSHLLKRLFYNPHWNDSLFLVSCAERLMQHPTEHSHQEIITRLRTELKSEAITTPYLQFRLICISRQGTTLNKEITYLSESHPIGEPRT